MTSIVQTSTVGYFGETLSATTAFGTAPTPGNGIIYVFQHNDSHQAGASLAVADNGTSANSYSQDVTSAHVNGLVWLTIGAAYNIKANSGNPLTLTVTANAGGTQYSFGSVIAIEVPPLVQPVDKTSTNYNASGTTPTSGSTGSLSATSEIALCGVNSNVSLAGITTPPAGFTDLAHDLTSANFGAGFFDFAYQIVSANTALNPSWGTASGSSFWNAAIATYQFVTSNPKLCLQNSNSGGF